MLGDFVDKIICGDVLEVLADIESDTVDMIFADPPFNIGKKYKDNRTNYQDWCDAWISESFRILKKTGSFYCMTLTRHLDWKMPLMAKHGVFINLITWRNVSAAHNKRSFWMEYQPIMLYGKTENYIFNTYAQTDIIPTIVYGTYRKTWRWGGFSTEYRGQLKDRWDDIPFVYAGSIHHPEAILLEGTNKKAHPCQMPIGLAERAILFSSKEQHIVLDPFVGSRSTVIAAWRLKRHYIGIDLELSYCKIAEERLRSEKQQLRLF